PLLITLASRTTARPGDKARVLDAGLAQAPQTVAAQLGVEPMTQVIRRRQATVRDGVTAAALTSWFPATLADTVPDLLRKTRLAGEITGYEPAWGEDWVSARPPTTAEAREFGIKRGSPVVVVHSRRFGADDSVLEYSELIARADTRVEYRYAYRP
ncbi:MAG: UTRA domain-containing protein, partial [Streptosporangiaceae bacterium]